MMPWMSLTMGGMSLLPGSMKLFGAKYLFDYYILALISC